MKIITLHQPWASLVALGIKQYETRHWPTEYRGPLLIHAARRQMVKAELERLTEEAEWPHLMDSLLAEALDEIQRSPSYGCIVAIAKLSNCQLMTDAEYCTDEDLINIGEVSFQERVVGLWDIDRFAFQIDNATNLPDPIPFKSRQGKLLDAPVEVVAAVRAQLKGVA